MLKKELFFLFSMEIERVKKADHLSARSWAKRRFLSLEIDKEFA